MKDSQKQLEMNLGKKERWLEFAYQICALTDAQLSNMAFSDEAYFCLDSKVNTSKVRWYALKEELPRNFMYTTNKFLKKVMVFLGVHASGECQLLFGC